MLRETGIGELSGYQGEEEGKEPLDTADESTLEGEIPISQLMVKRTGQQSGFGQLRRRDCNGLKQGAVRMHSAQNTEETCLQKRSR